MRCGQRRKFVVRTRRRRFRRDWKNAIADEIDNLTLAQLAPKTEEAKPTTDIICKCKRNDENSTYIACLIDYALELSDELR